jgi:small GTP-binding protein
MIADDHRDPLSAALAGLSGLASEADRRVIADLESRLDASRLRVLIAGEAKRGKSTLVNALLGRQVLPSGVTPLTALATTVRYGEPEQVTVTLADGRTERHPLTALDDLVTERGNPGNARNLAEVTVSLAAPLLALGAELVDTPGTGSVHAHNTAQAQSALKMMDAAVFVLTADPPVSASERDLISRVAALSVRMFVVLNKADRLEAGELAEVLDFTSGVVREAAGQAVAIYPLSARDGLAATDKGFAAFAADLAAYLEHGRAGDLRTSVTAHARRLAGAFRDQALLARQAAGMRGEQAQARVAEFAARLAAVRERRKDAADLASAESRRMLASLNQAAGDAARDRTAAVTALLEEQLAGQWRQAPAGEIERDGRELLATLAVAEAEAWRGERARIAEAGLAALDDRLTAGLRAELDAVRQAAAELLGLELTIEAPGQRLEPDLRFFYAPADDPGQTELLAGAVRRHLGGQVGRRRVSKYLLGEAASLVPRHIGRARADLQYRLAESTRQLIRAADARYREATGRLERALTDAARLRTATTVQAERAERELSARLEAIGQVLALLDNAASPSPAAGTAAVSAELS